MTYTINSLGFSLYPVKTRDGTMVSRLETPLTLAGEFPLALFVEETSAGFHVFDEGLTYHNLLTLGLGWDCLTTSIRIIAEKQTGVTFSDQGVLEAWGAKEEAPRLVACCMAAMINLDQWVSSGFEEKYSKSCRGKRLNFLMGESCAFS